MRLEQKRAFIIHFLHCVICIGIFYFAMQYALPLVAPFLLAFLLASLIHRPAAFLSQKWNVHYKIVSLSLLTIFYGCIGFLLSFLGVRIASWFTRFFEALPSIYANHFAPVLSSIFNAAENLILCMNDLSLFQSLETMELQLLQSGGTLISDMSLLAVERITLFAAALPATLIKILLMVISSYFITADYDCISKFCMQQLNSKTREIFLQIKNYVVNTLFVCIRSYILIMTITFFELAFGLWLLGVERFITIALLIAIFDILPVLGVGGVLIPWSILSILQGHYVLAIGLFLLYAVILVVRNILEPRIVGKQIGLHPVVTLASMFVGAQLFGILGLFGLPIGISLLQHLNTTGVIHIFNEKEASSSACKQI